MRLLNLIIFDHIWVHNKVNAINELWIKNMLFLGIRMWKIINAKHCSNDTRQSLKVLVAINFLKLKKMVKSHRMIYGMIFGPHNYLQDIFDVCILSMKSEFSFFFSITPKSRMNLKCNKLVTKCLIHSYTQTHTKILHTLTQ